MRGSDPKLKQAIGNVLNEIDGDLTTNGYTPSSDTEDALEKLDNVIIELDSPNDSPIDTGISTTQPEDSDDSSSNQPPKGFRNLDSE